MAHRALTLLLALVSAVTAHAQSCDDILDAKLLDQSSIRDQSSRDTAATYASCLKQNSGNSGGGTLKVGSVSLGGSAASSSALEDCKSQEQKDVQSYYHFAAQQGLKESAVEAWRACMLNREDLQCWPSPVSDAREVEITVSWKNGSVDLPKVTSAPIANGFVFGESVKNVLIASNSTVPYGKQTFIVVRDDDEKPMRAIVNVLLSNRTSYSCSVAVPAKVRKIDTAKATPAFIQACNSVLTRINSVVAGPPGPGATSMRQYPRELLACAAKMRTEQGTPAPAPASCASLAQTDAQKRLLDNAAAQMRVLAGLQGEARYISQQHGMECPVPAY